MPLFDNENRILQIETEKEEIQNIQMRKCLLCNSENAASFC